MEIKMENNQTKLLIVDDEQIILDSINKLLKKEENLIILSALSVDSAIDMMSEYNPDIILTDLMMPDKDGLDFLKILKDTRNDAVVIMLTGYATINTALQAMELGAFDYISKPFTKEEINRVLNRAVEYSNIKKTARSSETAGSAKETVISFRSVGSNTWFYESEEHLIVIGVERPFVLALGAIENIYLPEPGDEIRQGSVFFSTFSSDLKTYSLTSPLTGIVKEINHSVISKPSILSDDPYNKGWLIKLKATNYDEELQMLGRK
jgi:FixJ family two-component response regulator/glycine cleavage system H lipoate-binding protein